MNEGTIFLLLAQPNEVLKKITEPIFERVLTSFRKYYEVRGQGGGQVRLGKVLLTLVHTEGCEADHLEEMFFSGMMGAVNIDTVIPYILGMRIPSLDTGLSDEDIAEADEDN